MDDISAQQDEILALKSIYEDEFFFDEKTRKGSFYVKIESLDSNDFRINFVNEKITVEAKHLPPIQLIFEFKEDYPSKRAPNFQLKCYWLTFINLSKLCQKLDLLWQENSNSPILFNWISFLSDQIFDYLNLNNELMIHSEDKKALENEIDSRAQKLPGFNSHLIKNYDKDQVELKFKNSYFVCKVCFTDNLGNSCIRFSPCSHVFCNECMKGYFESQITSGNIKSLNCPHEKCDSQATQAQVLNLVGIDLFNRYDNLLLKDSLNNMTDIVYCPRVNCQSPIIPEDTLAQCNNPSCNYVFCAFCRQGYHGIEPCKITNNQLKEICFNYKNGDKFMREQLIKKYGEKRIKSAIEESSSMELIENTSKQCPQCKSWMQKLDGCNKMTCIKCHAYFCWLCKKILSKSDPYSHFNSANSECFDKLFEGAFNEQEDHAQNENNENFNELGVDGVIFSESEEEDFIEFFH